MKDSKYHIVIDHYHYTGQYRSAVHIICNLKYSVPKKIHIAIRKGSKYDYHFIKKELAEELKKKQFICLGENTEKYITFTVPIEKQVIRIDENREEVIKHISYILQFIDSTSLMTSPL